MWRGGGGWGAGQFPIRYVDPEGDVVVLIGILSVSPEGYMYLERILMYLKCILNDGERKSYMYVVSCHFACISTCIPKKSQNTFEIHVRYIMIHLTCILGASLVSPHGYRIRIHQDLHQDPTCISDSSSSIAAESP